MQGTDLTLTRYLPLRPLQHPNSFSLVLPRTSRFQRLALPFFSNDSDPYDT